MFDKRYSFSCELTVRANVIVAANSAEEAQRRLTEGAWHGVVDADWDKSKLQTHRGPDDITITGSDPRD